MPDPIDLRAAMNAISDVVQNRPRPLREYDQIYMKTGDMVMQSELVAKWADNKRLAFIGDGDAISVCVAYLKNREIFGYGPSKITQGLRIDFSGGQHFEEVVGIECADHAFRSGAPL